MKELSKCTEVLTLKYRFIRDTGVEKRLFITRRRQGSPISSLGLSSFTTSCFELADDDSSAALFAGYVDH